jgi:hypothetical protein
MGETMTTTRSASHRGAYALAFAALCAVLVAATAISSAGASTAKVIGHTKHTPGATCPNAKHPKKCNVIGRVTGFMTVADGKQHPFRVEQDGKLVAWAVDLGRPTDKHGLNERTYFGTLFENKQFGSQPTGRIAVLKHKNGVSYKLLRQSPVVGLGNVLGRKQIFTLNKPLPVRKGSIVAFTSPTWTPNFTDIHLTNQDNKWRGSRKKDNCGPKDPTSDKSKRRFARNSHAHQKVGSIHTYECRYSGGRLLYWAYFVPKK